MDLRLGDSYEVLADVEPDVVITDPPYGERTHSGHNRAEQKDKAKRKQISYQAWGEDDVFRFVDFWHRRTKGWIVAMTSHDLIPHWERAFELAGRFCFAPLPYVKRGMTVRRQGDGPSSWTVQIMVARPRRDPYHKWGTLDGAYIQPEGYKDGDIEDAKGFAGAKSMWIMRALVRDYSRKGDLICDPFAGTGTTLLAAEIENRRAVGAEVIDKNFAMAQVRIDRGFTPTLFGG